MQIHAVITQKVMKAFRVSHTGLILKSFFFFFTQKTDQKEKYSSDRKGMLSFLFIGFVRFILLLIRLIITAGYGRPCRYRWMRLSVFGESACSSS